MATPFIPQNMNQMGQQEQPFVPSQQQPFIPQQQQQYQMPVFQRAPFRLDSKEPRRRRQLNMPPNPNFYPNPSYSSSGIFQNGQIYPTMDPQFSVQAQISSGANGDSKQEVRLEFALTHSFYLSCYPCRSIS